MKKNKKQFYRLFQCPSIFFTVVDSMKDKFNDVDEAWEFYKNDFYYDVYKDGKFLYQEKNPTKWISDFRYHVSTDCFLLTGKIDESFTVEMTNKERKQ